MQGSLLEQHRANVVTKMLIAVSERGRGRLFWLSINGGAIRVKTDRPGPRTPPPVCPKQQAASPAACPPWHEV